MNPLIKFYASVALIVSLLFVLAAVLVQLVRDLRQPERKAHAEIEADALARRVLSLIHKRRGFFAVSARDLNGRLIDLERFPSFADAKCFVEQTGIERIYAMAEEKTTSVNKKKRRLSKKAIKSQQLLEAQMKLGSRLLIK